MAQHQRESTCGPDHMAGFSILAASEPRQRFLNDPSSETCCLADDVAVMTHTQQELQALMDRFSRACKDFGLTISLNKTNVLLQDTMELPAITIHDSMSLNILHILAPSSLTMSPWTRGLERQPQHLLASLHECRPTPN